MRRELRNLCKTSGKISYRDRDAALWGASQAQKRLAQRASAFDIPLPARFKVMATYPYQCPDCGHWHLTKLRQDGPDFVR